MKQTCLVALAVAALASCSSPEDVADATGVEDQAGQSAPVATGDTATEGGEAVAIEEESELYSFSYSYPGQVAAIPELKARFDREQAQSRKALIAQAREARADAKDMGFPYNAYALGTSWEVVADTPRFLSLSADIYTYSGGAHPNSTATSLVWDREARRALEPLDFFASPEALNDAVSEPYCKSLNDQRAERTGEPVDNSDPVFGGCPTVEQLTVVLGSTNGKTFDRIGLIAPPYVAGSYAEGEYAVTLPVTEPVMKALKPAYREAFARR